MVTKASVLPLLFVVLTVARAPAQFGAIVGSPGAIQALWTVVVAGIVIDRVIVTRRGLDRLAVAISALLLLRAGLSFVALAVGRPGAISFASAALSGMLTVMASAALYRRNRASFLDAVTAVVAVLAVLGTLLVVIDALGIAVPGHRFTMQVATNRVALATPFGLAEDYSRVGSRILRLQSFFDEPGTASMVLVPAAGLAVLTRRRGRAVVITIASVLTFSVGALAGILLGAGFALFRGRRGRWVGQLFGVVLGVVATVLAVPGLTRYVTTKLTKGGDTTSISQRLGELGLIVKPGKLIGSEQPVSIGPLNQIRVLGIADIPVELALLAVQARGFLAALQRRSTAIALSISALTVLGLQRIDPLSFPAAALLLYATQREARMRYRMPPVTQASLDPTNDRCGIDSTRR